MNSFSIFIIGIACLAFVSGYVVGDKRGAHRALRDFDPLAEAARLAQADIAEEERRSRSPAGKCEAAVQTAMWVQDAANRGLHGIADDPGSFWDDADRACGAIGMTVERRTDYDYGVKVRSFTDMVWKAGQ